MSQHIALLTVWFLMIYNTVKIVASTDIIHDTDRPP